jgi:hypothetical protein
MGEEIHVGWPSRLNDAEEPYGSVGSLVHPEKKQDIRPTFISGNAVLLPRACIHFIYFVYSAGLRMGAGRAELYFLMRSWGQVPRNES